MRPMLCHFCFTIACFAWSLFANAEISLQEKIEAKFLRFEEAQKKLLLKLSETPLPHLHPVVDRLTWESWLKTSDELALTESDFNLLKSSQALRIARSKRRAQEESVFDLDRLRQLPAAVAASRISEFCAAMPKGGMLHVHPSGTLKRDTVERLLLNRPSEISFRDIRLHIAAPQSGKMLYPDEWLWLNGMPDLLSYRDIWPSQKLKFLNFFVLPAGTHPFTRFESVFEFIDTAVLTFDDYHEALLAFAKRAASQKVSYVELTSGVAAFNYEMAASILQDVESKTGVKLRINQSFVRNVEEGSTAPEEYRQRTLDALLALGEKPWVVGIDLLANEEISRASALEAGQLIYGRLLSKVLSGESRLHRTMHAGELGLVDNPRDAMILGAERLGHGVLMQHDLLAMEYAARRQVAIEVNLVSNLRLTKVQSVGNHPYLRYLRLGIP